MGLVGSGLLRMHLTLSALSKQLSENVTLPPETAFGFSQRASRGLLHERSL